MATCSCPAHREVADPATRPEAPPGLPGGGCPERPDAPIRGRADAPRVHRERLCTAAPPQMVGDFPMLIYEWARPHRLQAQPASPSCSYAARAVRARVRLRGRPGPPTVPGGRQPSRCCRCCWWTARGRVLVYTVAFLYGISFVVVPAALNALLKEMLETRSSRPTPVADPEALRLVGPVARRPSRWGAGPWWRWSTRRRLVAVIWTIRLDEAAPRRAAPLGAEIAEGARTSAAPRLLHPTVALALCLLALASRSRRSTVSTRSTSRWSSSS